MSFIPENDPRVAAAVERIRGLKQLATDHRIRTYESQSALLKQLSAEVLATEAMVLARNENRGESNVNRSTAK